MRTCRLVPNLARIGAVAAELWRFSEIMPKLCQNYAKTMPKRVGGVASASVRSERANAHCLVANDRAHFMRAAVRA